MLYLTTKNLTKGTKAPHPHSHISWPLNVGSQKENPWNKLQCLLALFGTQGNLHHTGHWSDWRYDPSAPAPAGCFDLILEVGLKCPAGSFDHCQSPPWCSCLGVSFIIGWKQEKMQKKRLINYQNENSHLKLYQGFLDSSSWRAV